MLSAVDSIDYWFAHCKARRSNDATIQSEILTKYIVVERSVVSDSNLNNIGIEIETAEGLSDLSFNVDRGNDVAIDLPADSPKLVDVEPATGSEPTFSDRLRVEQFANLYDGLRSLSDSIDTFQTLILEKAGDDPLRIARFCRDSLIVMSKSFATTVQESVGLRGLQGDLIDALTNASERLKQEGLVALTGTAKAAATIGETAGQFIHAGGMTAAGTLPTDLTQTVQRIDQANSIKELVSIFRAVLNETPEIHHGLGVSAALRELSLPEHVTAQAFGAENWMVLKSAKAILAAVAELDGAVDLAFSALPDRLFITVSHAGETTRLSLQPEENPALIGAVYTTSGIATLAAVRALDSVTTKSLTGQCAGGRFEILSTGDFLEIADCLDSIQRARDSQHRSD